MWVGVEVWMRGLLAQSLAFVGLAVFGFFWRLSLMASVAPRPASVTFSVFELSGFFLSSHQAQLVYRFIILFHFRPFILLLPQHRHHGCFFLRDSIGSTLGLKNYAQSFFPFSSYPPAPVYRPIDQSSSKLASLSYLVQIQKKCFCYRCVE